MASARSEEGVSAWHVTADAIPPEHRHSSHTEYEKLIRTNVAMFHANFNARTFEKNGLLVADDIRVHSNGVELRGREAFIGRIKRYQVAFPDMTIHDVMTIVDGNRAAIRYVMTGTHTGPLETPDGVLTPTGQNIVVDGTEWFTFNDDAQVIDLVTIVRNEQLLGQLRGRQ